MNPEKEWFKTGLLPFFLGGNRKKKIQLSYI